MHTPLLPEETARLRRLPPVSRAREHRLYTADGKRWIDLWADGGRALLGHRPGGVGLRIKNELDRGLYAPYPGRWEKRLEKQLFRLFPGYSHVSFFASEERALALLPPGEQPLDPLDLPGGGPGNTAAASGADGAEPRRLSGALWGRPLLPGHPVAEMCFPILPLSGLGGVQPVLFSDNYSELPPSDLVSPLLLAALTRVSLILGSMQEEEQEALRQTAPPVLDSGAVNNHSKERKTRISLFCADIWDKRGPYMLFRGDEQAYSEYFELMFSRRVLIAPGLKRPSIFPASAAEKELRLLCFGERMQ